MTSLMPSPTFDSPDASWSRLRRLLREYDVALFLGAGVMVPNGLPSWKDLVARLSGWGPETIRSLQRGSVGLTTQLQLVRRRYRSDAHWTEAVRGALYRDFRVQIGEEARSIPGLNVQDFGSRESLSLARVREFFALTNPALMRIIEACSVTGPDGPEANEQVAAVLTTNLDGLIQVCDRACHGSRILRTVERATASSEAGKISLYHLHGYLQLERCLPRKEAADRLVLTEDEYLQRNDDPYSWANVTLHWALREFPVIFVGCSMTDDLIRRALRRSVREQQDQAKAVRSTRRGKEWWRRQFAVMQLDRNPSINRAVNESLAFLGVWPLWVRDYRSDLLSRLHDIGLKESAARGGRGSREPASPRRDPQWTRMKPARRLPHP